MNAAKRVAEMHRRTKETDIHLRLDLDGTGQAKISTGLGFLDHMLTALTLHWGADLMLTCSGDLRVDDHHTVEDCGLSLGQALQQAIGDKSGIRRFGSAYAPLDEALARLVVDFSGRPWAEIHLGFHREKIGDVATENLTHFFQSLGSAARCALHVDCLRGTNDHHRAEAAFKSLALALREALQQTGGGIPSTKGSLE